MVTETQLSDYLQESQSQKSNFTIYRREDMQQLGARYPSISPEGSVSRGQGGLFLKQKWRPDQFNDYMNLVK